MNETSIFEENSKPKKNHIPTNTIIARINAFAVFLNTIKSQDNIYKDKAAVKKK